MLTKFLQLFDPYPGNHYMQVTTIVDDTTRAISDIVSDIGEFSLVVYGDEIDTLAYENVTYINNLSLPFRALPRSNDILVLKDIFSCHKNQDMLLKLSYKSLANTADIIVMEKKGILDIEATKELLTAYEFRAANGIDIMVDYDLVIAKKMHMWGNGL